MYKLLLLAVLFTAGLRHATAAETYKRIVSLTPSVTQSLYYLGAEEKLVGCTSYCRAAQGDKPVVASAIKPNIEKIVSLKPDLVIASGLTSVKDIETLRKFGIRVEIFPAPKSFEQICTQFETLGSLTGKQTAAAEVLSTSRTKIKELQKRITARGAKIFIQIGADPVYAVIPGTFMDDYIILASGKNITQGLTKGTISRELVVARQPDYIFIVTMGIVGEEEQEEWAKFKSIPASRNGNIRIIDSEIACQPTPVTFVQTLELIINYMQNK